MRCWSFIGWVGRQAVERLEEAVGEDRVDAVVHPVQVRRERDLRGVERRLVSRLHARDVVLDRAPPPLEARRDPRSAVLAPPPLAVRLALLAELVGPDRGDDPHLVQVQVHLTRAWLPAEPEPRHRGRGVRGRRALRRAPGPLIPSGAGARVRADRVERPVAVRGARHIGRRLAGGARGQRRRRGREARSSRCARPRPSAGIDGVFGPCIAATAGGVWSIGSFCSSSSRPFSPGARFLSPACCSLSAIFVRSLSPVSPCGPAWLPPGVGFGSSRSCDVSVAAVSWSTWFAWSAMKCAFGLSACLSCACCFTAMRWSSTGGGGGSGLAFSSLATMSGLLLVLLRLGRLLLFGLRDLREAAASSPRAASASALEAEAEPEGCRLSSTSRSATSKVCSS